MSFMVGGALSVILATVATLTMGVPAVRADGGVVRLSETAGPFDVTVFTSPTPFRAGPADISVLVRDRATEAALLDAEVSLHLASSDGASSIDATATRKNATNKLLYCALLDVPQPGPWRLTATVRRDGSVAEVGCELSAAPPLPPLLAFWPWLALPAIAVALFGLNQWLGAGPEATTERR